MQKIIGYIIKGETDKDKVELWGKISTRVLYPEKETGLTADEMLEIEYGIGLNGEN